jgi:ribose transport system ATP-binding protein
VAPLEFIDDAEVFMTSDGLLLKMEQIDKSFPGVHALDHVDFDLYSGEVHILLGQNGAGKSTLVKILCGSLPMDSGRIFINGQEIRNLTPRLAQQLGIGMVYQELSLIPAMTVAENIFINRMPRNRLGLIDWQRANDDAAAILERLGVRIDPRRVVRNLNVSEQQMTEIARVLSLNCRILLLDEPTSALSEQEVENLFDSIRRLQDDGVGIIYISHRLDEVPQIGQRVTVMRDGRVAGTLPVEEANRETLIQMMIGRTLTDLYPKQTAEQGEALLQVEGLSVPDTLCDLSFELHRGEVLGVFGLMGAGQTELAEALFGLQTLAQGTIVVNGQELRIRSPADAIRNKMAYLTRDRREGLVPMQTVPPNITLVETGRVPMLKLLHMRRERELSHNYVQELEIRPAILDRPVSQFSGGNQQKIVLARWMASEADILILDEPTRGIDVGAKAEVFELINQLTQRGAGVILISSEASELIGMADRILVMKDGRFVAAYTRDEATQEQLLDDAS